MFLTSKSAVLLSVLTHSNTSHSPQCSWYSRVWPSHQWLNADAAISVMTGGITCSTCRTVFKSPGCLDPLYLQNPDKPTQTAGPWVTQKKNGSFRPNPTTAYLNISVHTVSHRDCKVIQTTGYSWRGFERGNRFLMKCLSLIPTTVNLTLP